jgi:hypothetical protein
MSRLLWCLKQLLPLTYRSHYGEHEEGLVVQRFAVWKMWFGRCYKVEVV